MAKEPNIEATKSAQDLDQFFTKKNLAERLYKVVEDYLKNKGITPQRWLEPSAGGGAFFNLMPCDNRTGIDIVPQIAEVIQSDFLEYDLPYDNYITVGNPPFGKNSSLAIKFFNKCAEKSDIIAFIVPKTFKKQSAIAKLNNSFHLEYSEAYNVPCVFQIWEKNSIKRPSIKAIHKHIDFNFCNKDLAHFAIQRVGANAGAVKKNFLTVSPHSHYFINGPKEIMDIFTNIDWSSVKYNTAGNPSIAKGELINLYEKEKNKINKGITV
jgi:hypothetical protein